MREDLRKLSWFEIARRAEELTEQCEANEDTIQRQGREVASLRLELKAAKEQPATPHKTTADGVETWHNLPVLIPVGLIPEGRTPCEVRSMVMNYDKEWVTDAGVVFGGAAAASMGYKGSLRILLADKPATVGPPQFDLGKHYRNRRGEVRGPICRASSATISDGERAYNNSGRFALFSEHELDLLPGAVDPPPSWTPPASLPDGDYQWNGTSLGMIGRTGCFHSTSEGLPDEWRPYRDLTAPKVGRWRVTSGKAEWLGDA